MTKQAKEFFLCKKFLLVGSGFQPGAKALLQHGLRQKARVALVPEPGNPYDPLAVRVEVEKGEVVWGSELGAALAGYGFSKENFPSNFHLGHLAASRASKAAKAAANSTEWELNSAWHEWYEAPAEGKLWFDPLGNVFVEVTAGAKGAE